MDCNLCIALGKTLYGRKLQLTCLNSNQPPLLFSCVHTLLNCNQPGVVNPLTLIVTIAMMTNYNTCPLIGH
jgi:hypothetical protein